MPEMTREEFAFTVKQKYPEYRDMDNDELVDRVVAKYPEYRHNIVDLGATIRQDPNLRAPGDVARSGADLLRGIGAGASKSVVGLGQLGTRLANALKASMSSESGTGMDYLRDIGGAFSRDDASTQPFDAARADIEDVTPDSTSAKVGETGEQMAEFLLPGAVAKLGKAGLLATAGREALMAGAVGSAQQGNLDPASAVGGAGGAVLGRAVEAGGRALKGRAARTLSHIIRPRGEHSQGQVTAAIEELVNSGQVPVGGIETLAEKLGARADELGQHVDDFRAGAPQELDPVAASLGISDSVPRYPVTGTPVNAQNARETFDLAGELANIERTGGQLGPGGRISTADADAKLRDLADRVFAASSDPAAGSRREVLERVSDALRAELNTAQPGRSAVTTPFANARSLADAAQHQAAGAPFREPPVSGQILALSALGGAGVGAATQGDLQGAGSGALIAASIPLLGSRLLKSPLWRSFSAAQQAKLAQILTSVDEQQAGRIINSLLQIETREATQ